MPLSHGKLTVVIVNAVDLSQYVKQSEFTRGKDTEDTTPYGQDNHVYDPGLGDNAFSMSGNYDTTAGTGPRAVLRPLADSGAKVTLLHRPEGTGAGKPQDSVQVIVEKYVESAPAAGYRQWSAD